VSKKTQQVLLAYLVAHAIHWLFNAEITELARKRGWSAGQIEVAKVVAGGLMLAL
jgi:hypothetical protein